MILKNEGEKRSSYLIWLWKFAQTHSQTWWAQILAGIHVKKDLQTTRSNFKQLCFLLGNNYALCLVAKRDGNVIFHFQL